MSLVVVYADDREIDRGAVEAGARSQIARGDLVLLRTGVGKVRTTMELTRYLTSTLRARRSRPTVLNVGTCAAVVPGLLGEVVRPASAIDRDSTDELLLEAKIPPPPRIELARPDSRELVIASGDSFLADVDEADRLAAEGVSLVDMETHAVGWASQRCLVGSAHVVRVVVDEARPGAAKLWRESLPKARQYLTEYVLELAGGLR